jgi:TfoX/Sxy family transcriptional regulator of competence genes
LLEYLRENVQQVVQHLDGVGRRKMLVSIGWTVKDRVFALVSRQGRIVVRLPDDDAQRELLRLDGAGPWHYGTRAPPRGWLQLPESMHDDTSALKTWLERAWQLGRDSQAKPRRRSSAS